MATKEVIHHDYSRDMGDKFLSLVKLLVSDPEVRHERLASMAKMSKWMPKPKATRDLSYQIKFEDRSKPINLSSPFFLPAGANKYGDELASFANLGLGALTVGTATKNRREGNTFRPRVRMIDEDRMIQNSMGLNNPGVDLLTDIVDRDLVKCQKVGMAMGISVSETPGLVDEDEKVEDLLYSFRKAYQTGDYVEVNVSCPNTGHQRIDEQVSYLHKAFYEIMKIRKSLPVRKAVYAKLSPDMSEKKLHAVLDVLKECGVNGLILFNTFPGARAEFLDMKRTPDQILSVTKEGLLGGLSGRPLYENTFRAVEYIKNKYPEFSILASGGIDHGSKAFDLIKAGADAVQCYSVVAYRWQAFHKMKSEFEKHLQEGGFKDVEEMLLKYHV